MTTITNIATRVLNENNYTSPTTTITEYLIKRAVEYVNLRTGATVSFTPVAGAESLTASDAQLNVILSLSALLVRAYNDKGPNASIGVVSIQTLTSDPQYSLDMKLVDEQIMTLIGVGFDRVT